MFNKSSSAPFQVSSGGDTTFIASDCHITGTITIKGNARIDGQVEGTVKTSGDLIIGANAKLKATIEAKNVQIAGEVQGDILSTNSLELSSNAKLTGDIQTQQLKIEQGARFIGSSKLMDDHKISDDKYVRQDALAVDKGLSDRSSIEKRRNRT